MTRIVIHDWVSKVKNLTRTCAKCTRKEPSIEPTHCPACGELLEEAEDPSKHQLKTQAYATALYHVYHVMADGLTEYGTEKRRHQPLPPPPIPPPKK